MERKTAWLNWEREKKDWVLRLWKDDAWEFSKSWSVKDEDVFTGYSWVCDSILCEISHLQELGYTVQVTV